MKKHLGYFLAGLLGAAIGSLIPALHAQGGLTPELREIWVRGTKVVPENGIVKLDGADVLTPSGNTVYIIAPPQPPYDPVH